MKSRSVLSQRDDQIVKCMKLVLATIVNNDKEKTTMPH